MIFDTLKCTAMKRFFAFLLVVTTAISCKTLSSLGIEPSALETATALRKVLDSSTLQAIAKLKQVNDNGLEAVLPGELAVVLRGLRTAGLGGEVDLVTAQIEAATRVALVETEGTIHDAIKTLRFKDAAEVVLGGPDAATAVMRDAMYVSVKQRYRQQIDQELDKTEANQYWPIAASAFNLFSKQKVDGNLSDFLAEKAVDGVFLAIGKEEKKARASYRDMGDQVVTKVFDYYTKR